MPTIDEMNVALGVDERALRTGLERASRDVQRFSRDMERVGSVINRNLGAQLQSSTAASAQALTSLSTAGRAWGSTGQRVANASVQVAFGLEALARGGSAADAGLRTALRSVAALAAGFGPHGLLVSGVAASLAAVLDFTSKSREALRKLKEDLEQSVAAILATATPQNVGDFVRSSTQSGKLLEETREQRKELQRLKVAAAEAVRVVVQLSGAGVPVGPPITVRDAGIDEQIRVLEQQIAANETARRKLEQFTGRELARETERQQGALREAAPERALKALQEFSQRVSDAAERVRLLRDAQLPHNEAVETLVGLWQQVIDKIEAAGRAQRAPLELIRAQQRALDALSNAAARQLRKQQLPRRIQDPINPPPGLALPTAAIQKSLEDVANVADRAIRTQLVVAFQRATAEAERLDARTRALTSGVRGILQLGDALGGIGDNARRSIDGVVSLIGALDDLKRARAAAVQAKPFDLSGSVSIGEVAAGLGVAGAIAAAVSGLVGVFTAQSEGQRAQLAAIEANNERLREVRDGLIGFTASAGNIRAAQRAVVTPGIQVLFSDAARSAQKIAGTDLFDDLNRELEVFGLTFRQLNAIARDNGIALLDEKGRLVAGSLQALQDVLGASVGSLLRFSETLQGQRDLRDFLGDVLDIPQTPQERLQHEFELLRQFAPQLAATFGAFDATTEAGRAAIDENLSRIARAIADGTITLEQLQGLTDITQLAEIVRNADNALDEFAEAAREATREMIGVPEGFKKALAQIEFEVQDAIASPLVPRLPTPPLLPLTPPIVPLLPPPDVLLDRQSEALRELADVSGGTGAALRDLVADISGSGVGDALRELAGAAQATDSGFARLADLLTQVAAPSASRAGETERPIIIERVEIAGGFQGIPQLFEALRRYVQQIGSGRGPGTEPDTPGGQPNYSAVWNH